MLAMIWTMAISSRRQAMLLILAIILLSAVALAMVLLLIRAWRNYNQRLTPPKAPLPPTDIWHAAADRMKLPKDSP